jgi:SAM-dependent methyltransferase
MTSTDLLNTWRQAAAAPFEGWDFSYLKGRFVEGEPPWDYRALAKAAVAKAANVVDLATGGGEVFASFAPFPGRASAVEGYEPNLPVARRRLEPLGVSVFYGSRSKGLPLEDGSFDLVLNRHGGFKPADVRRILKPGGTFLTQQVGGDNLEDLAAVFGASQTDPDNTLEKVRDQLAALGFDIRRAEDWRGEAAFLDVGAVVYFLKAIPWVVQGFEVDRDLAALQALQARLEAEGPLKFTYTRFLIEAVKPA